MRIPMDLASPRYKGMPLLNTSWPCRLTQQFKALNHLTLHVDPGELLCIADVQIKV